MLHRRIFGVVGLSLVISVPALAENTPSNEELFRMLKAQQQTLAQQQQTIRELRDELKRDRQQSKGTARREQTSSRATAIATLPATSAMAANIPAKAPLWTGSEPPRSAAGIYGGVELVYLKPYASEDGLTTINGENPLGFNPSLRYWLGVQNDAGLGARLRYWSYRKTAADSLGATVGVDFHTFDAEVTQRFNFQHGHLLLAAGYRHAKGGSSESDPDPVFGFDDRSEFTGSGLTVAVEGAMNVVPGGWLQVTGSGRWSALYGTTVETFSFPGGGPFVTQDSNDLAQVLELRAGGQLKHRFANGGAAMLAAGMESQYWHNIAINTDTQSTGFFGFYLNGSYKHPF